MIVWAGVAGSLLLNAVATLAVVVAMLFMKPFAADGQAAGSPFRSRFAKA